MSGHVLFDDHVPRCLMSLSGSFLHSNDQQGCYPPSYYHASANPHQPLPKAQGSLSCDVCIIGAGYMGLSSALHLAQKGYDVILLDAHRVGWGHLDAMVVRSALDNVPSRMIWKT